MAHRHEVIVVGAGGAGLTAAVELPLVLHSTLLDSTAMFATIALAACILMARIADRPQRALPRRG